MREPLAAGAVAQDAQGVAQDPCSSVPVGLGPQEATRQGGSGCFSLHGTRPRREGADDAPRLPERRIRAYRPGDRGRATMASRGSGPGPIK
eukprot:7212787-Alexandrium_andersonii.AAC.1